MIETILIEINQCSLQCPNRRWISRRKRKIKTHSWRECNEKKNGASSSFIDFFFKFHQCSAHFQHDAIYRKRTRFLLIKWRLYDVLVLIWFLVGTQQFFAFLRFAHAGIIRWLLWKSFMRQYCVLCTFFFFTFVCGSTAELSRGATVDAYTHKWLGRLTRRFLVLSVHVTR